MTYKKILTILILITLIYSQNGSEYVIFTTSEYTVSAEMISKLHSEDVDDGFIVMGSEDNTVFDEANCLEPGDAAGSYNTSPSFSVNDDGYGMVGVVGFFSGAADGNSSISNYHTGIFRLTDDHGSSWSSSGEGDCGYYFIPNEVWGDIIVNHFEDWGDGTGQDDPDCEDPNDLLEILYTREDQERNRQQTPSHQISDF